jgi:hypothetical protein
MSRTPRALVAALAAGVLLAAPAHAQLTVKEDAQGDGRFQSDIKKFTVDHTEKRVVMKLRMFPRPQADADELPDRNYYFVDTRGDAEPDFVVTAVVKNELADEPATYISTVDGWPPKNRPWETIVAEVDCGLKVSRKRDGGKLLVTTIGRGCLKTDGAMPTRLRFDATGHSDELGPVDLVGDWKQYTKWVTAD